VVDARLRARENRQPSREQAVTRDCGKVRWRRVYAGVLVENKRSGQKH